MYNKSVQLEDVKLKVNDIVLFSYEDKFGDEYTDVEVPLYCPQCGSIQYFVKGLLGVR